MPMKALILAFAAALLISTNGGRAAHVEDAGLNEALSLIQQDLDKATETLNHATDLLKKAADRGLYERYGTCVEEYRAAVSRNLPSAATDLKSEGYHAVIEDLKATAQHADNCEQQFAGSFVSPFTDETKAVKDLAFQAIGVVKKFSVRR